MMRLLDIWYLALMAVLLAPLLGIALFHPKTPRDPNASTFAQLRRFYREDPFWGKVALVCFVGLLILIWGALIEFWLLGPQAR